METEDLKNSLEKQVESYKRRLNNQVFYQSFKQNDFCPTLTFCIFKLYDVQPSRGNNTSAVLANLRWSTRRVFPIVIIQSRNSASTHEYTENCHASIAQWGYVMLLSNFWTKIAGSVPSRRRDFTGTTGTCFPDWTYCSKMLKVTFSSPGLLRRGRGEPASPRSEQSEDQATKGWDTTQGESWSGGWGRRAGNISWSFNEYNAQISYSGLKS